MAIANTPGRVAGAVAPAIGIPYTTFGIPVSAHKRLFSIASFPCVSGLIGSDDPIKNGLDCNCFSPPATIEQTFNISLRLETSVMQQATGLEQLSITWSRDTLSAIAPGMVE
ncbi:hypothetical protein ES705_46653 [subsurface metagenome]